MNLTISGHHLEVTPALREYVLTKLDRVTRHFDQVVDITVLLSVEKLKEKERRQKAEVRCTSRARTSSSSNAHEDLYAAIDQLMDKLDRQVVPPQGQGRRTTTTPRPSASTPDAQLTSCRRPAAAVAVGAAPSRPRCAPPQAP